MKKDELIKRLYTHKIIGDKDLMQILEEAGFKDYAISSIINKIADITNAPLPPAEGAEQRIRVRNILQDFYRRGEYELEQAEEDIMRLFQPQPPAEGAVPDNAAEQNKRMREWFKERTGLDDTLLSIHMKQIDVMLKGVQPQPTAEGAEEILRKNCNTCYSRSTGEEEVWSSVSSVLIAMQDFATLHAQRIAEKMVSERLREELIRYIKWYGGFNYENMTDEMLVNEYLKTREK